MTNSGPDGRCCADHLNLGCWDSGENTPGPCCERCPSNMASADAEFIPVPNDVKGTISTDDAAPPS